MRLQMNSNGNTAEAARQAEQRLESKKRKISLQKNQCRHPSYSSVEESKHARDNYKLLFEALN